MKMHQEGRKRCKVGSIGIRRVQLEKWQMEGGMAGNGAVAIRCSVSSCTFVHECRFVVCARLQHVLRNQRDPEKRTTEEEEKKKKKKSGFRCRAKATRYRRNHGSKHTFPRSSKIHSTPHCFNNPAVPNLQPRARE